MPAVARCSAFTPSRAPCRLPDSSAERIADSAASMSRAQASMPSRSDGGGPSVPRRPPLFTRRRSVTRRSVIAVALRSVRPRGLPTNCIRANPWGVYLERKGEPHGNSNSDACRRKAPKVVISEAVSANNRRPARAGHYETVSGIVKPARWLARALRRCPRNASPPAGPFLHRSRQRTATHRFQNFGAAGYGVPDHAAPEVPLRLTLSGHRDSFWRSVNLLGAARSGTGVASLQVLPRRHASELKKKD